ncbi:MAG TPA: hypothetical protein VGB03_02605, partial [Acidimicrobiales bacterium]
MSTGSLDLPESVPPGLRRFLEPFGTERGRRVLWWALGALLVLTFFAFLAVGANGPDDPSFEPAAAAAGAGAAAPVGDEAALRITSAGGKEQVACVLVADD